MPLSIPVNDLVSGDSEEPRRQFFDRFRDAVACDQLKEDVLQNVFGILIRPNPAPYEFEQPSAFSPDSTVNREISLSDQGIQ